jgi:hypothetical protein
MRRLEGKILAVTHESRRRVEMASGSAIRRFAQTAGFVAQTTAWPGFERESAERFSATGM